VFGLLSLVILCASGCETEGSYEEAVEVPDTLDLREYHVFGNGEDETEGLQTALNESVGNVLYIPKQEGAHYLTGQLVVPDSITIICHPDVVFMAKDDLHQAISNFEVMWRFENSQHVIFDGQGALF